MILIFGGAYQGKLEYALKNFGLDESDVYHCEEKGTLDLSHKVIYGLERFVLGCVREGKEAKDLLLKYGEALEEKIIIVTDISQGVVPIDPELRSWREMTGRAMLYLGSKAEKTIRIFCGLGQEIKC